MTSFLLRSPRRARMFVAVTAVLISAVAMPAAAEPVPATDEALRTLTCTGLLDGVDGSLEGELAALGVDASYCHTQSDTTACAPEGTTCTTEVQEQADDGTVFVDVTG